MNLINEVAARKPIEALKKNPTISQNIYYQRYPFKMLVNTKHLDSDTKIKNINIVRNRFLQIVLTSYVKRQNKAFIFKFDKLH